MLLRNFRSHLCDLVVDVRRLGLHARRSDADRTQQDVGELERARLRDVEAVQKAPADQVEVGVHRDTGLAIARAQPVEHRGGLGVGLEQGARVGVCCERGNEPVELRGRTRRPSSRPRHR